MRERKRRASKAPAAGVIVEEVLSAILSPARVRDVLDEALRVSGMEEVPDTAVSLRVFVEGPLFSALSRHLGISDALDVGAQIRAALALALRDDTGALVPAEDSAVRERRSTMPGPGIRVLAATKASVVVFLIQDMLGEGVEVVPIPDGRALVDRLRRIGAQPSLILVDRRHPCVDLDICAALNEHAPATTTVVWWGAEAHEQLDVEDRLALGPRLIPTHRDMELADLGELVRGVLELM